LKIEYQIDCIEPMPENENAERTFGRNTPHMPRIIRKTKV